MSNGAVVQVFPLTLSFPHSHLGEYGDPYRRATVPKTGVGSLLLRNPYRRVTGMIRGTVKWFNDAKGYGVHHPDGR